jgi:hypothetical protein
MPHHAKLASYERKLIGLVKVVKHWHPYLWTQPFIMRTDHYSLKYLLDQRLSTIPQHAWVSKLFWFQFFVEFKPGRLNAAANVLSRRNEEHPSVHALSSPDFEFYEQFHREAASLPEIAAAREEILAGRATKEWQLVDDMVVYAGRLLLSTTSSFWTQLLEHAHGMGHEGVQKTLQRLRASFTPHDTTLVHEYIWECSVCQRNKTEHLHPAGLLRSLDVLSSIWTDITMDYVEGFPKVGGKCVILTVIDWLSKYTHFVPLGHPYSATSIAKAFFDQVVRLHGIPASIVSDRDPVFTSKL